MTASAPDPSFYQNPWDYEALFGPSLQDVGFYTGVARRAPSSSAEQLGGSVLELGCGTGRLLWPLAEAGIAMEGLDQSAAMLKACREVGERLALNVPLHQADWRHFDLRRRFGAILLPFNGLQHLCEAEDLRLFFERLRAHLDPGGLFALDVHLPQAPLLARERGERFGVEGGPQLASKERVVAEQSSYDALAQVQTQIWTLAAPNGDTREISLALRQFFPQELQQLLAAQGFGALELAGGFKGEALTADSLKQVICCKRL